MIQFFPTVFRAGLLSLVVSGLAFATPSKPNTQQKPPSSDKMMENLLKKNSASFEKLVQKYISDHPEVIYEALVNYQKKETHKKKAAVQDYMKSHTAELFDDKKDGVLGNPKGKTTIMVLSDYNCGYCRKAATMLHKMIKTHPDLRVVVKQLPILGQESNLAARIAMLAKEKNVFKKANQVLLGMEKPMNKDKLVASMTKIGLKKADVEKALTGADYEKDLSGNYAIASQLAIQGTPALLITNHDRSKVQFIENFMNEAEVKRIIESYK